MYIYVYIYIYVRVCVFIWGWFRVGLGFVYALFRVSLFWCSSKVLRFVEVSVNGSKHCGGYLQDMLQNVILAPS